MSTKEKLITHVMKEEPIGTRNKVTVVGVGMVGMASAISVLLKVRWKERRGVKIERVVRCAYITKIEWYRRHTCIAGCKKQ